MANKAQESKLNIQNSDLIQRNKEQTKQVENKFIDYIKYKW
jgi:hypothetical protein